MRLFVVLCLLIVGTTFGSEILEVNQDEQKQFISIAEFKNLPYGFPSPLDEKHAVKSGQYNASIITRPYGFAVRKDTVFLTMPRLGLPIPYTLAVVTNKQTHKGPKLRPFPSYAIHKVDDKMSCENKIVSVFRPNMDECGQLWVIDTGRMDDTQVCPPKIMAFDPKTGEVLHQYTFPDTTFIPGQSMFSNFVLRSTLYSCYKNMFYIADPRGHRLVVYNQSTRRSWYIEHPAFKPEDQYIPTTVNGTLFPFPDGIYQTNFNKTHVIFHPHASISEYAIPLSLVNNEYVWKNNPSAVPSAVTNLGVRSAQWSASTIDKNGNMYGLYTTPSAVYKWDTSKPYIEENQVLVARNDETLQFGAYVKIVRERDLYVLTTRLQKAVTDSYDDNEINFRLLKCSLDGLNSGSDCGFYND